MMRILVAHKVRLTCELMATALRNESEIEAVDIARSAAEALTLLADRHYDVALVNINLPDQSAVELTRAIVRTKTTKVIITGLVQSKAAVIRCVEVGAAGYVLEEDSLAELIKKIRQVHKNQFAVSPAMSSALIARVAELKRKVTTIRGVIAQEAVSTVKDLTEREWEILRLIEAGASNQQIADKLFIELGTVKNHVHNILTKLDVQNRKHAVVFARQMMNKAAMQQPSTLPVAVSKLGRNQPMRLAA